MAETNRIFQLITPFINQVQLVENMLNELRTKRRIATCHDAQLDGYGDILDVPRMGMDDTQYYAALLRKILYNTSSGQSNAIITFLKTITGKDIEYTEPYIATVRVNVMELLDPLSLYAEVYQLKPAGVRLELVYMEDDDLAFNFGDEGTSVSEGYGFYEDGYPESNGYIAGQISEKLINI